LLNILPRDVAEELKEKGEAQARKFENVTILFTDFKGFTAMSEALDAQELVTEIDTCFKAFDQIITARNIEKIKTIGDAYMAAAGLHGKGNLEIKQVILAGLEMQEFIINRKKELQLSGKPGFEMRVGIHTGTVVAGIVGVKKFQYDLWGDSVNIASRMESHGEINKVNLSTRTYQLEKDNPDLVFEARGMLDVKGLGPTQMYFVDLKN